MAALRRVRTRARALGAGLADLVAAEIAALRSDLRASAQRAGTGGILILVGVALLMGAVAALAVAAFESLTLVLPRWAAAFVIAGGLAIFGLIVLLVGRRELRRVESPVRTLQRRAEEHRDWWRARLAGDPVPLPPEDEKDR